MVPWTTGNELAFIKRIGQHAPFEKKTVIQLLEGYIYACQYQRVYWGAVDKKLCIQDAQDRLDRIKRG